MCRAAKAGKAATTQGHHPGGLDSRISSSYSSGGGWPSKVQRGRFLVMKVLLAAS